MSAENLFGNEALDEQSFVGVCVWYVVEEDVNLVKQKRTNKQICHILLTVKLFQTIIFSVEQKETFNTVFICS